MKKLLLAVTALLMFNAMFAQTERVNSRQNNVAVPYKNVKFTGREVGAEPQHAAPMTRVMNRNYIGTTFYDLQTNGSMANKMVAHNDGTISAVWTTCGETAASRGTGYNYFNGSTWTEPATSTSRIENTRAGWGTLATIGDVEIVASHNGTTGLVIGICPQKGTENWTFTTLQGPTLTNPSANPSTSTCLLWPALATTGNIVHLIACTESDSGFLYQGIQTCLVYYRGTFNASNNTISWEEPRIVGNVTSAEVSRFSGDSYAITAKNNTVAIVAFPGSTSDGFLWKSTDQGVNFTKTVFWESAVKESLAPMMDTTLYVPDGSCAVAIGDDGVIHIATGAYLVVSEVDTGTSYFWYPGIGYLLYWRDNQAPITYNGDNNYLQPDVLRAAGYTVIERFNLDCDETIWGIGSWGIDNYPSYGVGTVSFPQLVAQNGKVYMTFCQMLESPFVDLDGEKYYRGVFATKSDNNGSSFGDISWLSYNKDCYYLESWELFPLDTNTTLSDVREYITSEGESVFPAVAPSILNGQIHMFWQQDYYGGTEVKDKSHTVCQNESNLYYFTMKADSIGIYNNVNEVCQGLWIDHTGISNRNLSGMKMYPNPATETVNITFSAENAENGVLSVMNIMGQTIYTKNVEVNEGYNMITLPVKQFNSGVYMVSLRTNTGVSTQKLIVK